MKVFLFKWCQQIILITLLILYRLSPFFLFLSPPESAQGVHGYKLGQPRDTVVKKGLFSGVRLPGFKSKFDH